MKNDVYDTYARWAKAKGVSESRLIKRDGSSQRLSVNLTEDNYKNVKSAAKKENVSMSCFIRNVLIKNANKWWRDSFVEKYAGIFEDDPLELPEDLPWEPDENEKF